MRRVKKTIEQHPERGFEYVAKGESMWFIKMPNAISVAVLILAVGVVVFSSAVIKSIAEDVGASSYANILDTVGGGF